LPTENPPGGQKVEASRLGQHGLVLALYTSISFALFGVPVASHPASSYIGFDHPDPALFMWFLKWWPYALTHGLNPFVTDYVWAPEKVNLLWSTSIPGPALALAPVTLAAGPVVSYNLLMLAAPALAAWTAYLLCRQVSCRFWPSAAGGYLFGFSSYELGHLLNHLNLVLIFVLPLFPLLVLRRIGGVLSRRRFVLLLAGACVLQFLISTEMALSATLFGACALGLAFLFADNGLRRKLTDVMKLVLAGAGAAAAVLAPFLYYALLTGDAPAGSIRPPAENSIDLLNFGVPTHIALFGTGTGFQNLAESGAYVGLPLLVLLGLFALREWRTIRGRLLLSVIAISGLASLGPVLHIDNRALFALPWKLLTYVPLVNSILPARLTVYGFLAVAVSASLWLAAGRYPQWPRWALFAVAVLALFPAVDSSTAWWHTSFRVPRLFVDGTLRDFVAPGGTVIVVPYGPCGRSMLWQADADMGYRMAGGYIGDPPKSFASSAVVAALFSGVSTAAARNALPSFLASHGVQAVLVADGVPGDWTALLRPLGRPIHSGGVRIYRVRTLTTGRAPNARPPTHGPRCADGGPSYGTGL
jgi:hypothetical protein